MRTPLCPACRGYEASPFVKVVRELLCELEIPHVMVRCCAAHYRMLPVIGDEACTHVLVGGGAPLLCGLAW